MFHTLLCGLCGSIGSLLGKLALNGDLDFHKVIVRNCQTLSHSLPECSSFCSKISYLVRASLFCLMIFFNIIATSSFLKALERNASLPVTVVSSSINFLMSGLIGWLAFNETVSLKWFSGAGLILIGVLLIILSQKNVFTR
mmetsp:Transcript_28561/g.39306  ORF Transcript_28561/g.39306 Transcript_28561/m.39306 type:complete len:141 (-) Transcript_28561:185-607(-)